MALGRPRAVIDQKNFEGLCAIQCTEEEICAFFGITTKTLGRWCKDTYNKLFSQVFEEKRKIGKISLRRNMFRQAEHNATLAIWLSKQHLGMTDKQEIQQTVRGVESWFVDEKTKATK